MVVTGRKYDIGGCLGVLVTCSVSASVYWFDRCVQLVKIHEAI